MCISLLQKPNGAFQRARLFAIRCKSMCTPGMGMNLWGESPLYVNHVNG